MANFAIIMGNTVTNIIVADTLLDAQDAHPEHLTVVEDKNQTAIIGSIYDGVSFKNIEPTTNTSETGA